jgi:tRNA 2-thiocytidine biosynthesis protein TtcA
MLDAWERESPGRVEIIARALGNIHPSQLSDPRLFDFLTLGSHGNTALPKAQAWLARTPEGDVDA